MIRLNADALAPAFDPFDAEARIGLNASTSWVAGYGPSRSGSLRGALPSSGANPDHCASCVTRTAEIELQVVQRSFVCIPAQTIHIAHVQCDPTGFRVY
jgi:hypothetical protein